MAQINEYLLLKRLISKGDRVKMIDGRLEITPASNKPVPKSWLANNRTQLAIEMGELTNIHPYLYYGYSTGFYTKHKAGGVTLQFTNIVTGLDSYAGFNAELNKARKSKNGNAGAKLPKGQFRVKERHEFYKFWRMTGLKIPSRLSVFHQYMGNLKGLYFTAKLNDKNKFINKETSLMNVRYNDILSLLGIAQTDKPPTTNIQQTDKAQTIITNNEIAEPVSRNGSEPNKSTCQSKCELRNQGSKGKGLPISICNPPIKNPIEQTNDEWISDWENA